MNEVAGNPLSDDEMLARFVLKKEWIRKDSTIKQDAFIPPKDLQLSVTRHAGISAEQLIETGKSIAVETSLEFFGRADIETRAVVKNVLKAVAWPLAKNQNHAHVVGWPADKEARKSIAQELAASAVFFLSLILSITAGGSAMIQCVFCRLSLKFLN